MNGKNARKIRQSVGGQEIQSEREYFGREGNTKTFRLKNSTARRKYQKLKRVFYSLKAVA